MDNKQINQLKSMFKYSIYISRDTLGIIHATINNRNLEHELLEIIEREY
jgi:hypothetical protein